MVNDKLYSENKDNIIDYGYLEQSTGVSAIEGDFSKLGETFKTNRYGNVFSYKFSELPKDRDLAIVVDIMEHWHNEPNKRVFDIKVETDVNTFTFENVDPYVLSVNTETGAKSPCRIAINLPQTSQATVSFISKEGYDIATIHSIGIIGK
jgi:hypothetical protein